MTRRNRLRRWLIKWAEAREPDFVIGDSTAPYLRRWWLIPRNPLLNVYVHQILRSDDDRALHDHPWINCTWVLRGSYVEVLLACATQPLAVDYTPDSWGLRRVRRYADNVVLRRARTSHRLEIDAGPCWTLFITGPRLRAWGFRCPQGWRHWRAFTSPENPGAIGRGCE